jgi:nucleoside-diphosphate-sugar epimerase
MNPAKNMKILVTSVTALIGSAVAKALLDQGYVDLIFRSLKVIRLNSKCD